MTGARSVTWCRGKVIGTACDDTQGTMPWLRCRRRRWKKAPSPATITAMRMCGGGRACSLVAAVFAAGLAACSAAAPHQVDDACAIFSERKGWYDDALDANKRWGVPISIQLAFIRQESSFESDAKPPRRKYLGFIPGERPSDAFGYAQALDSTWDEYRHDTGERGADRDEFADAVDFIGWYNARSANLCGIRRDDAYSLYLAYHEGPHGYRRGTYRQKQWLMAAAERVAKKAERYRSQLKRCEKNLEHKKSFLFF